MRLSRNTPLGLDFAANDDEGFVVLFDSASPVEILSTAGRGLAMLCLGKQLPSAQKNFSGMLKISVNRLLGSTTAFFGSQSDVEVRLGTHSLIPI